jgi:hypothetical protein
MLRKRHTKVLGAVLLLLVILVLSCLWRVEPAPPGLAFEKGDGTIGPLFVMITNGQLETNWVRTATGMRPGTVGYAHKFYTPSEGITPVPALRYWV